jgi:hypothetical protein
VIDDRGFEPLRPLHAMTGHGWTARSTRVGAMTALRACRRPFANSGRVSSRTVPSRRRPPVAAKRCLQRSVACTGRAPKDRAPGSCSAVTISRVMENEIGSPGVARPSSAAERDPRTEKASVGATQERYGLTIVLGTVLAVGHGAFFVHAVSRSETVSATLSFIASALAGTLAIGGLVLQRRSRTKSG